MIIIIIKKRTLTVMCPNCSNILMGDSYQEHWLNCTLCYIKYCIWTIIWYMVTTTSSTGGSVIHVPLEAHNWPEIITQEYPEYGLPL